MYRAVGTVDVTDTTSVGERDDVVIREAEPEDYGEVVSFTENTWPERGGDSIPVIYHDWIADDGADQRTFVVCVDDRVRGICQGVLLSPYEAWAQGMRVDSEFRGAGLSSLLNDALFNWAAARGAAVCRNMVFSSVCVTSVQLRLWGYREREEHGSKQIRASSGMAYPGNESEVVRIRR